MSNDKQWYTFDEDRPTDEQEIEVLGPNGTWTAIYLDDGINGLLEHDETLSEIEEYKDMLRWRPREDL